MIGNASAETEQHLGQEVRRYGWNCTASTLTAAFEAEIDRLETQTLRRLRETLLS